MEIKKGQLLKISHARKGKFIAIADEEFDAESVEFFPVSLYQEKTVEGMVNSWEKGESIPCRASLVSFSLITEDELR